MPHIVTIESDVELPEDIHQATISSLVSHVLASENVHDDWQVGMQFVDDPTMQAAHAEFMDIDEPTDIMTFPYADEDDIWGDNEAGGDLIISVDTARENAEVAGWSHADELHFLVAHGILHLLGWDDHSAADRSRMLDRQRELLQTWSR